MIDWLESAQHLKQKADIFNFILMSNTLLLKNQLFLIENFDLFDTKYKK